MNFTDLSNYVPKKRKSNRKPRLDPNLKLLRPCKADAVELGNVLLGQLVAGEGQDLLMPLAWDKCYLHWATLSDVAYISLRFHQPDANEVLIKSVADLQVLFAEKSLQVSFSQNGGDVMASLYLQNIDDKWSRPLGEALKLLFRIVYGIADEFDQLDVRKSKFDMAEFYRLIYDAHKAVVLPEYPVLTDMLVPTLRPYQEAAVKWMIHRERSTTKHSVANPLYTKMMLHSGQEVYFDCHTGHLTTEPVMFARFCDSGGILSDEMGLGKTVEVLACIVNHKQRGLREASQWRSLHYGVQLEGMLDTLWWGNDSAEEPLSKLATKLRSARKGEPVVAHQLSRSVVKREGEPPPKREKPSDDGTKKRVSTTFELLNSWYQSNLALVNQRARTRISRFSCVCGVESSSLETIVCVRCGVKQHTVCMGYLEVFGEYHCPNCSSDIVLESSSTLIVCPDTLLMQWSYEIKKHLYGDFRVFIYRGSRNYQPVYSHQLLDYDLVLTTYNVLQHELRLTDPDDMKLRRTQRYCVPGSPICQVKWWRVVLDEAQMVESSTHMISECARRIPAVHRWAVSGTPIANSMMDLVGMLSYLLMPPYSDDATLYYKLYRPYVLGNPEAAVEYFSRILWRTEKAWVLDQIDIPNKNTQLHWLDFSPVEAYYYRGEHELTQQRLGDKINKSQLAPDTSLDALQSAVLKDILSPLLAIRQVCSHHAIVKGRFLLTRKTVTSTEDLLEALINRNVALCEEHLRAIIAAVNGMAGIQLINGAVTRAVALYKRVLALVDQYSSDVVIDNIDGRDGDERVSICGDSENGRITSTTSQIAATTTKNNSTLSVDKPQHIHALWNLLQAYELLGPNVPEGEREKVSVKYEAAVAAYLRKFEMATLEQFKEVDAHEETAKIMMRDQIKLDKWTADLMRYIMTNGQQAVLRTRMNNALMNVSDSAAKQRRVEDYCNLNHLELLATVNRWGRKLQEQRNSVQDQIFGFCEVKNGQVVLDQMLIFDNMDCHLLDADYDEDNDKDAVDIGASDSLSSKAKKAKVKKKKSGKKNRRARAKVDPCRLCRAKAVLREYEGTLFSIESQEYGGFEKNRGNWLASREEITVRSLISVAKLTDGAKEERTAVLIKNGEAFLKLLKHYQQEFKALRKFWTSISEQVHSNDELNMCKERYRLRRPEDGDENLSYVLEEPELETHMANLLNDEVLQTDALKMKLHKHKYLLSLYGNKQSEKITLDPCPVCKNDLTTAYHMLQCAHCMCPNCLKKLLEGSPTTVPCPVCRQVSLMREINYVEPNASKAVSSGEASSGEVVVQGDTSTKVAAIVRKVLELREADADVKIIIFSNWLSLLTILQDSFAENNVKSEVLKKSSNFHKTIEKFKDCKTGITALLMPISTGSKGLNLTEASHIMFVEPVLNLSDELQAIGRAHRLGQNKSIVIHKFMMKDSIEEKIHVAQQKEAAEWEKNKLTLKQLLNLFEEE